MERLTALFQGLGILHLSGGQALMLLVSLLLLWLAIARKFEPLLLMPIGFGGLLANIPDAGLAMSALEMALYKAQPDQLAALAARLPAHLLPGCEPPRIEKARYGDAGGARGAACLNLLE